MGEPIAVLALRRRRDHISGVIAEYERKIKDAQHDLIHVVASLRLSLRAAQADGDEGWSEPRGIGYSSARQFH